MLFLRYIDSTRDSLHTLPGIDFATGNSLEVSTDNKATSQALSSIEYPYLQADTSTTIYFRYTREIAYDIAKGEPLFRI